MTKTNRNSLTQTSPFKSLESHRISLHLISFAVLFAALFIFCYFQDGSSDFLGESTYSITFDPASDHSSPNPQKGIKPLTLIKQARSWYKEKIIDREGPSTLLQNGGVVSFKDTRLRLLCKLNITRNCQSNYIADSVDLLMAAAPLYAKDQSLLVQLYTYHEYFKSTLKSIGLNVVVIEAIMPERNQTYKGTTAGREPWEIQITVSDTFYYRENLVNVAAKKTYDLWEYLIWIDGHQIFHNIYWWEETIYKLEHFSTAQLVDHIDYIKPDNRSFYLQLDTMSYMYSVASFVNDYGYIAGNAWGVRKEIYDGIGYVLDKCIAGGCDYSWCYAIMRSYDDWPGFQRVPHYFDLLKPWISHAHEVFYTKSAKPFSRVRGRLSHLAHEHLFDYLGTQMQWAKGGDLDLENDFERDSNFTLHIKNPERKKNFAP